MLKTVTDITVTFAVFTTMIAATCLLLTFGAVTNPAAVVALAAGLGSVAARSARTRH